MGKRGFGLADGILLATTEMLGLRLYPSDVSLQHMGLKPMHGNLIG
jgi:hypothetical protein